MAGCPHLHCHMLPCSLRLQKRMPELLHSLTRSLYLSLGLASLSLALWLLQSGAAMDAAAKLIALPSPLSSALHHSPLTMAPPSSAHAAPLALPDKRRWPLLLLTDGAAAGVPPACTASRPQATLGRVADTKRCARSQDIRSPQYLTTDATSVDQNREPGHLPYSVVERKEKRDHAWE